MNKENIDIIIKLISAEETEFDMYETGLEDLDGLFCKDWHTCNTPACIGGWIVRITGSNVTIHDATIKFFDISFNRAYEICFPNTIDNWKAITKDEAVQALEKVKFGCDIGYIWSHVDSLPNSA